MHQLLKTQSAALKKALEKADQRLDLFTELDPVKASILSEELGRALRRVTRFTKEVSGTYKKDA